LRLTRTATATATARTTTATPPTRPADGAKLADATSFERFCGSDGDGDGEDGVGEYDDGCSGGGTCEAGEGSAIAAGSSIETTRTTKPEPPGMGLDAASIASAAVGVVNCTSSSRWTATAMADGTATSTCKMTLPERTVTVTSEVLTLWPDAKATDRLIWSMTDDVKSSTSPTAVNVKATLAPRDNAGMGDAEVGGGR